MVIHDRMYSKESDKLIDDIHRFVSGYNCFCDVEDAFKNKIANKYLKEAQEEVLAGNNQGLGTMYYRAIENMSEKLQEFEEDLEDISDTHVQELYGKIHELEKENRILKNQLESIKGVLNYSI